MTFLAITKQVDAIITEDSDLIPFGCPRVSFLLQFESDHLYFISSSSSPYWYLFVHPGYCFELSIFLSQIIFKMDKFGHGVEFQASNLPRNKELSLSGFSSQMLLEMCILSGCDYLQSLPGMGLKRAHTLITKFKSYDRVHIPFSLDFYLTTKVW